MSFAPKQFNEASEENLFDIEVEQAVIGTLLANNGAFAEIDGFLEAESFYDPLHQRLFSLITDALRSPGAVVSPLTVYAAMKTDPGLQEVGGHAYLVGVIEAAPALPNLKDLASIIRNYKARRDATDALMTSLEMVKQPHTALTEALRPAQMAADVAADEAARDTTEATSATAARVLNRIQDAMNGKPIPKVTTGYRELDKVLGGMQGGDFIILAGRPGMMKTGVAGNIALSAASEGSPVLFFEQEMTKDQLLVRAACAIDYTHHPDDPMSYAWFRRGDVRDYQFERLTLAMQRIPDRMQIVDRAGMSIFEISSYARSFARQRSATKPGLVIIDYLQLIQSGDRYRGNLVQEVTEISKACKTLAKTLNWPVLVLSQLSREVEKREDKRPLMTDLRESGQLEQDADSIIGLYRHSYYLDQELQNPNCPRRADKESEYEICKNEIELIVRKNRHGSGKTVRAFCNLQSSAVLDEMPRGAR